MQEFQVKPDIPSERKSKSCKIRSILGNPLLIYSLINYSEVTDVPSQTSLTRERTQTPDHWYPPLITFLLLLVAIPIVRIFIMKSLRSLSRGNLNPRLT